MKSALNKSLKFFFIIGFLMFLLNSSQEKSTYNKIKFSQNSCSTVIMPNYKSFFIKHYESKYNFLYNDITPIKNQSK